jgi:hypothetical protein
MSGEVGSGGPRTEDQLRAALSAPSDGPQLDAGAIIRQGRSIRARRRMVAACGAVLIVVAGTAGVTQIGGNHGSSGAASAAAEVTAGSGDDSGGDSPGNSTGSSADSGSGSTYSPPSIGTGSATGAAPELGSAPWVGREPLTGTGCPAASPAFDVTPTGTGPLVTAPVTSLTVCVYWLSSDPPGAAQLDAAQGQSVVDSLTTAPTASGNQACTADLGPALTLIVGTSAGPVSLSAQSYGCGYVTSGANARAASAVIKSLLADVLDRLRPVAD